MFLQNGYSVVCASISSSGRQNLIDARTLVMASLRISKCACVFTCLKFLNSIDLAASPCMLSATTVLAKDLELPGLPTTNSGILTSMHTTIMNTFSLRAVFRAMLGPSSNSFSTACWQLENKMITYIYANIPISSILEEVGSINMFLRPKMVQ